jgi:phage recombination protein Bet
MNTTPAGIPAKMETRFDTVKNATESDTITALPDFLSKEDIALLKRTVLAKFPEDEQETFIRVCQRTRLDPFTKQIYPTRRYQKVRDESGGQKKVPTLVTVTGIMGLTALAERTGNYDGCEIAWAAKDGAWKAEWLEPDPPAAARCIVYHKRHSHPEVGIARWESYVGQQWDNESKTWYITDFWQKMGDYMLGKCGKAQALRGAFPDQLSNVYIREELESDITDSDSETTAISSDEQKIIENRRREEEIKKSGKFELVKPKEPTAPPPTPEQMAEPADVHKLPAKPDKPEAKSPAPAEPPQAPAGVPDNIDMSPAESPAVELGWKEHVIAGVTHIRFKGKKIGELNPQELSIIENQWLPAVRQNWDDATDDQRADARMFEAALAFHKMGPEKPW